MGHLAMDDKRKQLTRDQGVLRLRRRGAASAQDDRARRVCRQLGFDPLAPTLSPKTGGMMGHPDRS